MFSDIYLIQIFMKMNLKMAITVAFILYFAHGGVQNPDYRCIVSIIQAKNCFGCTLNVWVSKNSKFTSTLFF